MKVEAYPMRTHGSLLVALLLVVGALSACGNDGETSDAAPSAAPNPAGQYRDTSGEFAPQPHEDSGGGASQLEVEGGASEPQRFGSEASAAERERAAARVHAFFDARAAEAWEAACSYLSSELRRAFERQAQAPPGPNEGCGDSLRWISLAPRKDLKAEAEAADVVSLRVEGKQGYLLYRGIGGEPHAIPLAREGRSWGVASLHGFALKSPSGAP